jgi:hypothetical protein
MNRQDAKSAKKEEKGVVIVMVLREVGAILFG